MRKVVAQVYLFDTCTHRCSFCHLAETGKVLDASQLRPYRDPDLLAQLIAFFREPRPGVDRWLVELTGGEPLLMPYLARFIGEIGDAGHAVGLHTSLHVAEDHPGFVALTRATPGHIEAIQASFHPESEISPEETQAWFDRATRVRDLGHPVFVRYVGHPDRLDNIDHVAEMCEERGLGFFPTTLFSPDYPRAYTPSQREQLRERSSTKSQIIMLNGGIDTTNTRCYAGDRLISIDMRTGEITPCATVTGPVVGNLYDNTLELRTGPAAPCPEAGISCSCEQFFHNDLIEGLEDSENYARLLEGDATELDHARFERELTSAGLRYSTAPPGIGDTRTARRLIMSHDEVRTAFNKNRTYLEGAYAAANHVEFKSRQTKSRDDSEAD